MRYKLVIEVDIPFNDVPELIYLEFAHQGGRTGRKLKEVKRVGKTVYLRDPFTGSSGQ